MFYETRKTALLLCEGKRDADILAMSKLHNIYQLNKELRRTKLPQKILLRLRSLNDEQIKLLANASETVARLVCFLAIIKTDKLFFEFMREVYAEKLLLRADEIIERDFIVYFESKMADSPKVSGWTASNVEQIKNAYKRILIDAGLAKKQNDRLILTRAICDKEDCRVIRMENERYADAMQVI